MRGRLSALHPEPPAPRPLSRTSACAVFAGFDAAVLADSAPDLPCLPPLPPVFGLLPVGRPPGLTGGDASGVFVLELFEFVLVAP